MPDLLLTFKELPNKGVEIVFNMDTPINPDCMSNIMDLSDIGVLTKLKANSGIQVDYNNFLGSKVYNLEMQGQEKEIKFEFIVGGTVTVSTNMALYTNLSKLKGFV